MRPLARWLRVLDKRTVPLDWINQVTQLDARAACRHLPDACIDLIFTDPNYGDLGAYRWLAREARRLLKPGSLIYAYTGNLATWQVHSVMARQLDYRGTICLMGAGGFVSRWRMIGVWKPILMFSKGKLANHVKWGTNMMSSSPDKRYHRWGQGASPAFSAVRRCTKPGDLVLDPFCGGGTTAAVCLALDRRFLTFEMDPDVARIATGRLDWKDLPLFAGLIPETAHR